MDAGHLLKMTPVIVFLVVTVGQALSLTAH